MTDLLSKLRDPMLWQRDEETEIMPLCQEAADEIERLRAALAIVQKYIDGEAIADALVVPTDDILSGVTDTSKYPSLRQFVETALGADEQ